MRRRWLSNNFLRVHFNPGFHTHSDEPDVARLDAS
jgi:hypothetical protein